MVVCAGLMRRGNFAPLSKELEASLVDVVGMGDAMSLLITGMETLVVGKT